MSKSKTRLTIAAVLAVVASTLVSASPMLAQTDGQRLAAPVAERAPELPKPEVFVPAAPMLHADDAALLSEAAAPGAPSELRRPIGGQFHPSETTTAVSRHSVDADGKGTAQLYALPAFRRSAGRWVEVDSTLRPTARVDQPIAAEKALRPVRFGTSAERIVELGLDQGPVSLSSAGLTLGRPSLEGNTVVYRGVAADTDLRYVVSGEGVKEEVVLHSASAPRSFTFHLGDPSGQLGIPTRDEAGAWTFPNPIEEGVVLTLPPALAWEQGAEGDPVASDPASANLELIPAGDGWDLTVSVSDTWLEGKSFPVVLDPTLTYSTNYGDGPTLEGYAIRQDGSCGGSCFLTRDSYLYAGSWAPYNPVRSYVRYDLSDIPEDARIDSATFRIYNSGCMVVRSPDPCASKNHYIGLHRMVDNWSSSSRYDELAADTASSAFTPWIQRSAGAAPSYHYWTDGLTAQVQRWVNRSDPNYGFAIRSLNESPDQAGPAYASSRHSTTSWRPYLSVSYTVVAPGTPAVAAYAGNGAARVHWGIPNSGGSPIDRYLIYAYQGNTFVRSKTVTCPCPTVAPFEGLTNGLNYHFAVYAHNSVGYSAPATSPPVTLSAVFPTAPSPASASPGNAAARVDWSHPSTGAAAVDHYVVQAYNTDTGYLGAVTVTCPCPTTAPVGVLTNGKRYILAVFAHNEAGYGVPSMSGSVVPASNRPGPPRSVVAQAAPRAVDVSWQAPTISGGASISSYSVRPYDALTGYLGDAKAKTITCPCGTTAARIDGLAPGRTFVFAVVATTANGSGVPGLSGAVELTNVPSAPTNVRAVPGDGRAALSWEAATPNGSPVTGYTITASPGGATIPAAGDATSTMFEGLTNGTAYTFTAMATNAIGDSVASGASNEVTPHSDASLLAPLVAPTSVVATRGDTQAEVSWTKPTLSLPLLTTYDVTTYRASDGVELGTTSAGTDSSVTVTGLKNGTPVYFTVSAQSLLLSGTSERSNTITPAGPPFAPTDVVATRGDRQVNLSWNPPGPRPDGTPGDNGDPISSYTVTAFRADNNEEVSSTDAASSPGTVKNLANGTAYYFTVHATNGVGAGQKSVPTNTVIPAGRPFPPTNVSASAGAAVGEAIIRWSPPPVQPDGTPGDNGDPIVSYTVRAQPGGASTTAGAAATSTVLAGLRPGDTYTFTVTATNGVNESAESAPSNPVTLTGPPDPPTNVTAVASGDTATVNWVAPSRLNGSTLTGYVVTGTPVAGAGSEVSVPVNDPTATSTTVSGLNGGTTYEFRVVATSDLGNSAPSEPSAGVTPETEPGAPTAVKAEPGDARVTVSWTAPAALNGSQITGYELSVTPECSPACTGLTVTGADNTSTVVENGLTNGTSYTFRVRAKSTAGPGPYSAGVESIPHRLTHVAMGDSYSSGVGAEDVNGNGQPSGAEDKTCQRSDEAYGPVYHSIQSSDTDLVFLACGGAVTGHAGSPAEGTDGLIAMQKLLGDGGQLSRLPAYADLVTLTVGGNDVGFGTVLQDCFRDPAEDCDVKYRSGGPEDVEARINAMRTVLSDVYSAILVRSPNARVAILTYPQIITETDNCFEQADYVPSDIALSDDEKRWIRARTAQLAGVIQAAKEDLADPRLTLVDELGKFADAGHGICAEPDSERYANGIVAEGEIGDSFHPTAAGYRQEAEDLLAAIGAVVR